jgi:hypothetical protein
VLTPRSIADLLEFTGVDRRARAFFRATAFQAFQDISDADLQTFIKA